VQLVFVEGNPCFAKDTDEARVSLLKDVAVMPSPACELAFLNGSEITIDERVRAVEMRRPGKETDRLRLFLVLKAVRPVSTQPLSP
jgi:hypothetical protein